MLAMPIARDEYRMHIGVLAACISILHVASIKFLESGETRVASIDNKTRLNFEGYTRLYGV